MKCIVGIPTHKADWNIFERISLEQCDRILAEYDKAFIIPMGLELNCKNQYQEYKIERFPDIYFSNSRMYNELCLTEEFYKRFIDYDYMLIYQLDSFVFYDGLKKFCEKGFDYIGAPVITGVWETLNMNVGNGGLSLRNVKRVLGLLEEQKYLLNHSAMSGLFYSAEDTFFSYCGSRGEIDFRVPDIRLASEFSIEIDCVGLDASRREKLPFGTHGWEVGS